MTANAARQRKADLTLLVAECIFDLSRGTGGFVPSGLAFISLMVDGSGTHQFLAGGFSLPACYGLSIMWPWEREKPLSAIAVAVRLRATLGGPTCTPTATAAAANYYRTMIAIFAKFAGARSRP